MELTLGLQMISVGVILVALGLGIVMAGAMIGAVPSSVGVVLSIIGLVETVVTISSTENPWEDLMEAFRNPTTWPAFATAVLIFIGIVGNAIHDAKTKTKTKK
ncbi:TPA: hypothetical protein DDZ10_04735 [Candidatus Uhrbacteria bacterium]|uniref:Uncharacterized protein n=1 Tax=Candidatus Uhrbacteria bacterium GW2011_GWC2_53_7 TaxID=1618986 RepID=A0A0G1Y1I5_9BACT|nr:MAG: hypothetical protein UY82_C0004G0010 [Candidatus Uhrbacteria bacterium GW2011_GWC2_53_7]HBL39939.1 hypothetical protein [Candidatus Uhrbacteria bacterium]